MAFFLSINGYKNKKLFQYTIGKRDLLQTLIDVMKVLDAFLQFLAALVEQMLLAVLRVDDRDHAVDLQVRIEKWIGVEGLANWTRISHTTGFDDDLFLPAIGFKWNPSDRSDLFFAGPYVRYRYSLSDSFDLILGGQISGNRWNTEAGYGERDLRLRSYRLSLTGQWNLAEKHPLFASVGAELGREVEIKNASGSTLLERDLDEAPTFEIGYRFRF